MTGRYNQTHHATVDTSFNPGEEIHILTQEQGNKLLFNIRCYRISPSKSGHTGYTKKGFYLSRQETIDLRDALDEILADETLVGEDDV